MAGIPGAGAAITLVAVVALLSALNANLYGASRMVFSLSERGEAPRFLSKINKARVPVLAVAVSVAFGFLAAVLELALPGEDPAGTVPAGRLDVPDGLGLRPGIPADPPPPRGP